MNVFRLEKNFILKQTNKTIFRVIPASHTVITTFEGDGFLFPLGLLLFCLNQQRLEAVHLLDVLSCHQQDRRVISDHG